MKTLFHFRLFIAGEAPNSMQAMENLRALCEQHLSGRHEVEIIDVLKEPERSFTERVLLTPTLIRVKPAPRVVIVGNLSDTAVLLQTLGIKEAS